MSNIGQDRTFRCKRCSDSNRELGSHSTFSSPLADACDMFFSWLKPPIAVSLGALFPTRFRLHGRSYAASARVSIRRRCGSSSHWDREYYLLVSRSALLDLTRGPRVLPPSNRQACERHQSTKQAGKDAQRYDAQRPDDHKPTDAAELKLQCRERRHQW
jgi:hypothetical protein